ncbi:MAG TPA: hypothetical protein DEF06_02100, partial [Clostridiales bacterium]|nr:hypothetical protein [Clostridiales bacterium]
MKKYLKSASVLLLILVMTFTMVACKKPPMVTQEDIDWAVEEGEAEGEITFTYSPAATSADYKQAADKFVTAFEQKYTNVTVERDYTATSDNRIASADIGDVFYFAETQTYKYAVQDSALLPLDGFMTKFGINQSDVYSGIYALGLVNGRLYFVPRDYNQIVLIYNKSAITEAGLSSEIKPEWTWEEFQSICEQLYDPEGDYYPLNLNLTYSPVYVPFFEAYASRDAWCNTTDKRITFIDENGDILRAIGEALDMARKYYVMIPSVNESAEDIVGREYIFKTDVYPTIQGVGKQFDNRNIDWDIINMPLFQNPSFGCGASGVGVFARTQNVTAAAALALFFLTPEGQRAFNSGTGGSVPLLKSLDDEGYDAWKYPDDPA